MKNDLSLFGWPHIRFASLTLPRSTLHASRFLVCAAVLCSCSTQPRIGDVWSTKHALTIEKADQGFFGTDRASHIRVVSEPLSPEQTREEFYVTWAGAGVQLIKFEYRQPNVPDKIMVQTAQPTGRHWCQFVIAGDDYVNGGSVSAWRVSLWNEDRLLAEKKSSLW